MEQTRGDKDFSLPTDNEVVSSLPLQMSLYFNVYFFPFWWLSIVVMLHLKVSPKGNGLQMYCVSDQTPPSTEVELTVIRGYWVYLRIP